MPDSLGERVRKSKARVERQEHDYRVAQRQEREAQKKTAQRRNYVLGELVTKYFPEVTALRPGTKAENSVTFAPVDAFLAVLAEDKQLVNELKIRASEAAPAASEAP